MKNTDKKIMIILVIVIVVLLICFVFSFKNTKNKDEDISDYVQNTNIERVLCKSFIKEKC